MFLPSPSLFAKLFRSSSSKHKLFEFQKREKISFSNFKVLRKKNLCASQKRFFSEEQKNEKNLKNEKKNNSFEEKNKKSDKEGIIFSQSLKASIFSRKSEKNLFFNFFGTKNFELSKSGNLKEEEAPPCSEEAEKDELLAKQLFGVSPPFLLRSGFPRFVRSIYLPVGYPHSMANHYVAYVKLSSLQVFLNSAGRVLATQAMLLSVGMGKGALPIAAVLNWILKDGLGQVGGVVFATLVNTRFDSNAKRYRFQATLLGQLSHLLSILSLSHPPFFLFFGALASTFSRIGGVAHAACRARIYENFCKKGNLGDAIRCSQSQATTSTLLGTLFGVSLSPLVGGSLPLLLTAFFPLSLSILWAAFRSCCIIQMDTLNKQRGDIVYAQILENMCAQKEKMQNMEVDLEKLKSPGEVFVFPYEPEGGPILMNPPLPAVHFENLKFLGKSENVEKFRKNKYVLGISNIPMKPRKKILKKNLKSEKEIYFWLSTSAGPAEIHRGFFQACLVRKIIEKMEIQKSKKNENENVFSDFFENQEKILDFSERFTEKNWAEISQKMEEVGWNLKVQFFEENFHGRLKERDS